MDLDRRDWSSSRARVMLLASCGGVLWVILALFLLFTWIPRGVWDRLWTGLVVPVQVAAWLSNVSGVALADMSRWVLPTAAAFGLAAGLSVVAIVRLREE